jgi:hypothetical protein
MMRCLRRFSSQLISTQATSNFDFQLQGTCPAVFETLPMIVSGCTCHAGDREGPRITNCDTLAVAVALQALVLAPKCAQGSILGDFRLATPLPASVCGWAASLRADWAGSGQHTQVILYDDSQWHARAYLMFCLPSTFDDKVHSTKEVGVGKQQQVFYLGNLHRAGHWSA